ASLNSSSATASVTVQPAGSSSGAVSSYAFDENNGSTTADASGNGNTATLKGATWTTSGKYSNALSFNGSSSYVDLGTPASLQVSGSMSWTAWVFATGTPSDDGQIIARSDNSSGWQLKTTPDTGSRTFGVAVMGSGATQRTQRYSKTVVALNQWYH